MERNQHGSELSHQPGPNDPLYFSQSSVLSNLASSGDNVKTSLLSSLTGMTTTNSKNFPPTSFPFSNEPQNIDDLTMQSSHKPTIPFSTYATAPIADTVDIESGGNQPGFSTFSEKGSFAGSNMSHISHMSNLHHTSSQTNANPKLSRKYGSMDGVTGSRQNVPSVASVRKVKEKERLIVVSWELPVIIRRRSSQSSTNRGSPVAQCSRKTKTDPTTKTETETDGETIETNDLNSSNPPSTQTKSPPNDLFLSSKQLNVSISIQLGPLFACLGDKYVLFLGIYVLTLSIFLFLSLTLSLSLSKCIKKGFYHPKYIGLGKMKSLCQVF